MSDDDDNYSDPVYDTLNWRGLSDFIIESNKIEGEKTDGERLRREVPAYAEFLKLPELTVEDIEKFVSIVKPGNVLRTQPGMDVRVGDHVAPYGGPEIRERLRRILVLANEQATHSAYAIHHLYETLHPFTDGNGRSGRVIWLWMHKRKSERLYWQAIHLGFLHAWYYESLHFGRNP